MMILTIFIQVFSKNFLGTFPPCRQWYRTKELSRFQIHYYWKGKYDIPFQKLARLDFHWSKYLERFDSDSCQQQCQMHCWQCHVQCIWWPRTRFPRADFVEQSKKINQLVHLNFVARSVMRLVILWHFFYRLQWYQKSVSVPVVPPGNLK